MLPFLASLFEKCDTIDGYWTFLEGMYPQITYSSDDEYRFTRRVLEPSSFIFSAILAISGFNKGGIVTSTTLAELPYYEELVIERIPHLRQDTIRNRHGEVIDVEEDEDEETGYICQFSVADIRKHQEDFKDLLDALNDDQFICKKQYIAIRKFFGELSARQKHEDDNLLDLL